MDFLIKQCKESSEPFQYMTLCEPNSNFATPSCFAGEMLSPTPCEDGHPRCQSCQQDYFQPYNNNCSVCNPCTKCAPGQKVGQDCTPENDTVCIPLTPSPPAVVGASLPITPGTPTGPQILSATTPTTKTLDTSPSLRDPSVGRTGNVTGNTTEPCLNVVEDNQSENGDKIAIWTISAVALVIIIGLVLVIIYLLHRFKRTGILIRDENRNVPACMELNGLLPRDRCDPPEERYAAVGDDPLQNDPRTTCTALRASGGESSNHRQRVNLNRSETTNSRQEDCEGPSPIYATVNKVDGKQEKQPPGASNMSNFNGSLSSGSSSGSLPAEISSETHQDTYGKSPHRRNPQHSVKGKKNASSPQGENEPLLKHPKGNTGHQCNSSSGPSDSKSNDETSFVGKGTDIESPEDNSSESGSESNGLGGEGASSEEDAGAKTESRLPDLSGHQHIIPSDNSSPAGANPAHSDTSTLDLEENSFGAETDHSNSTPAADATASNQPIAKQAIQPDPSNPVTDDNGSCLENVDEQVAMGKGVASEDIVQPDDVVNMKFLQQLSDLITFLEAKRICRLFELPENIIEGIEHDKPYDDRNIELFKKALKILGKDMTYRKVLGHLSDGNKHAAEKLIEQFYKEYSAM